MDANYDLFITLFLKRETELSSSLWEGLKEHLKLTDQQDEDFFFRKEDGSHAQHIFIHRFSYQNLNITDTQIIQIKFALEEDSPEAIEYLTNWAHSLLNPLFSNESLLINENNFYGYTIVYRFAHEDPDSFIPSQKILNSISPILSSEDESAYEIIAGTSLKEGKIWWLKGPENTKLKSHSVYLAVGKQGESDIMSSKVLYSRRGRLLISDLFLHKAYRNYYSFIESFDGVTSIREQYEDKLSEVNMLTSEILSNIGQNKVEGQKINDLAKMFSDVMAKQKLVEEFYISIQQQISNFERFIARNNINQILQLQHDYIFTFEKDIEFLVNRGKSVIDTANLALNISEAKTEKQESDRREILNIIIAFIGVAIGVTQLLNDELIRYLLCDIALVFPAVEDTFISYFTPLGYATIRFVSAIGFSLIIAPLIILITPKLARALSAHF